MKSYVKPIGYIEKIGGCVLKKVSAYGKKYIVYKGCYYCRFATIQQARLFAYTNGQA